MYNLFDINEPEKICEYRGETYRVRENGSIFRLQRRNKRKRPLDEKWTFGTPDKQYGYWNFASEKVHRIVATAYHGKQPSEKHVVDHIDTNRKNNRPDNLRWITRLENILLNPITLSRIILKYGSIDNFLVNPSKPIDGKLEQNFDWMRTVTKEESDYTRKNLENWAKEGKIPKGGQLGEWIFTNLNKQTEIYVEENPLTDSLTYNAIQKNWKTQSEFPNCPAKTNDSSIESYKKSLTKGTTFSINQYGKSSVEHSELSENKSELVVLTTSDSMKPFALAKVYIQNEKFIHESLGTFFTLIGAQKYFNLALGLEWHGEDSIDDYC
ncbi:HNH endonuclease signature motif containing protein [Psychroserpens ponticola]|uniref:HNH endonuclease signature motif containing protein n=1 Tax=Psychroserpens ponticola TaxID=2932268 RepID=A0ABY7S3Z5_9FLAO|nr:HNH endonuclease signature motif containing protein [Psychroserpens ponticola]WCO03621.1 HNH endonuclease signature motif containing protein [Psychroserpens ponticola]